MLVSQLPEWQCDGYGYRTVTWALMKKHNSMPAVHYSVKDGLAYIRQEYLFPPQELNLLLLYSWPLSYSKAESPFKRVMAEPCFHAFEDLMKGKGYLFVGE